MKRRAKYTTFSSVASKRRAFPRRRNPEAIENLPAALYPYRRAAIARLRAMKTGRNKQLVGIGEMDGQPYVAIGTLAVPMVYEGAVSPPDVTAKFKNWRASVDAMQPVDVTYIPCITGHKNKGTWAENVHTAKGGMIDPVLLAMAVYAVGGTPRVYQGESNLDSIAVVSENAVAFLAPMRPPEGAPKPEPVTSYASAPVSAPTPAPRTPRTPRAPRKSAATVASVDPDNVWDGHDRVDPYLRFQRYSANLQPTLTRYLNGKDKNLTGWGEYDGYYYITDGYIALPGYKGSLPEDGGKAEAPNKQKNWGGHIHAMAEVVGRAASPEDARELTVTQIPLPALWNNKEYDALARHVLISEWNPNVGLDPKLFGMAVLAVGPNVRLFQSFSSVMNAVAVKGDKGVAVVMPTRID